MSRTFRTLLQSIVSPVLSTSLYFVVFGAAIGSRIQRGRRRDLRRLSSCPGLIMLTVLTQSIANASFGIYFPKFIGTILRNAVRADLVSGNRDRLCRRRRHQIADHRHHHPCDRRLFRSTLNIAHPVWMAFFLVLTCDLVFSLFGFIIGIWAREFRAAADGAAAGDHAARVSGRKLLLHLDASAVLADRLAVQPGRLSHQRVSLELLRDRRRFARREPWHDHVLSGSVHDDRMGGFSEPVTS